MKNQQQNLNVGRRDTSRSSGGDMSVREAGKKGGQTTSEEVRSGELPSDFYQQIGHKGGETVRQEVASGELPKDFYSQIGHKGGQKVKDLIEKGKQQS